MYRRWLIESLIAAVPQKSNNQMDVYDRLKDGDGKNTTKVQKLIIMRSQRLLTEGGVHFLMSLNSMGTLAHR